MKRSVKVLFLLGIGLLVSLFFLRLATPPFPTTDPLQDAMSPDHAAPLQLELPGYVGSMAADPLEVNVGDWNGLELAVTVGEPTTLAPYDLYLLVEKDHEEMAIDAELTSGSARIYNFAIVFKGEYAASNGTWDQYRVRWNNKNPESMVFYIHRWKFRIYPADKRTFKVSAILRPIE